MEIVEKSLNGVTLLQLQGRLDSSNAGAFKRKIKELAAEKKIRLVVDLADVSFVDSSGLGVLVASLRSLTQMGGDMYICGLSPEVRALFELTRLHKLFEIYENVDAAREGLK